MGIVAVVLCLTLVSSCLVSGVFAKYVTTHTAGGAVTLKAFGVTLSMALSDEVKTAAGTGKWTLTDVAGSGLALKATISNLKMAPGDEFFDALKVEVKGSPNVPVKVTMASKFEYATDSFLTSSASDSYYMPIGWTVTYTANATPDRETNLITAPYLQKTAEDLGEVISRNLANKVFGQNNSTDSKKKHLESDGFWRYNQTYSRGATFPNNLKTFYIGMFWSYEYGSDVTPTTSVNYDNYSPKMTIAQHDEIATKIGENAAKNANSIPVRFTYTIIIEQDTSTT